MDETTRQWLWLNYATNHHPRMFYELLFRFDDISEAFEAALHGEADAFSDVKGLDVKRLLDAAQPSFLDRYVGWIERNNVQVCTAESPEYPTLLLELEPAPSLLFYRGTLQADSRLPIAVVGSRVCSEYGKSAARRLGQGFSEQGATVVTGLAAGVDSFAAWGALAAKDNAFPVVGVIGCGIDQVYPSGNGKLYDAVAERGAVVSEFLPKTPPMKQNFPMRNRIISGMSRGVVVVEAMEHSGTAITVDCAQRQGREVYAVPGRITDPLSVGTNRLILERMAKPITCANDVINDLTGSALASTLNPNAKTVAFATLDERTRNVYMALLRGERNADELIELVQCSASELNATLTSMQFAELITQSPGRIYTLDTEHTTVTFD